MNTRQFGFEPYRPSIEQCLRLFSLYSWFCLKKNILKKANSALKLELLGIKTDHVRLTGEVMNPVHNKLTF